MHSNHQMQTEIMPEEFLDWIQPPYHLPPQTSSSSSTVPYHYNNQDINEFNLYATSSSSSTTNYNHFQMNDVIEHCSMYVEGNRNCDITNDTKMATKNMNFDNSSLNSSNNSESVSSSFPNFDFAPETAYSNPSKKPYPGNYDFQVSVEPQTKMTKSPNYLYSESMKKIFAKKDVPCPFLFRTTHSPPWGSIIRVTPIFGSPEHVNEVVKRCPAHMASSQNEPRSQVKHLLTSDHRDASHVEDPHSRRLCVVVPYEEPQVGSTWSTCLIQFSCFNSCFKSSSKRPLHLIFTLEHSGQTIGRQVVEARLCACPGRDYDLEMKKLNCPPDTERRKRSAPNNSQQSLKFRKVQKAEPEITRSESVDDVTHDEDGNEVFELKIRGRSNYEMLLKLRDSLYLFSILPSDIVNKYISDVQSDSNENLES